jgi:hypothetical protein
LPPTKKLTPYFVAVQQAAPQIDPRSNKAILEQHNIPKLLFDQDLRPLQYPDHETAFTKNPRRAANAAGSLQYVGD